MRWRKGRRSSNLEDRRFQTGGRRMPFPGGSRARMGVGGIVVLLVLSLLFGQDFMSLLTLDPGTSTAFPSSSSPTGGIASAEEEETVDFVSFVLDDVQATWTRLFPQMGHQYQESRLVLFRNTIESACGFASSASGPFYCPGDARVYIDLAFFEELKQRFGAPGDFAEAYVLAHEIGHHVQKVLGVESQVRRLQRSRPSVQNELSVMMELQADCFAGVWGHSAEQRGLLHPGDIEEGLRAAAAIGDDRIQKQSMGYVNPESFTHGTSAQRARWLRQGLASGDPDTCDTYATMGL